jgi:predicted nucleic acid-binding protein
LSAVIDTSALIALGRLRLLRLLPPLFGDVYIPEAVLTEWTEGSAVSLEEAASQEGLAAGWLQVRPIQAAGEGPAAELGPGEREVIALATDMQADFTVLDDLAARSAAEAWAFASLVLLGYL